MYVYIYIYIHCPYSLLQHHITSCVVPAIEAVLNIHMNEKPPATASGYTDELFAYISANRRVFRKATQTHVEPNAGQHRPDKSAALYSKAVDNFKFWFNGCLFLNGVVQHFVYGQYRFKGRRHVVHEMSKAFVQVFLARMPTKPEDGKWTLLGPCLDFTVGVTHVHAIFVDILARAMKATIIAPSFFKLAIPP